MCSYSNQNEYIKGGDACNIATLADEVCTLQCNICVSCAYLEVYSHIFVLSAAHAI